MVQIPLLWWLKIPDDSEAKPQRRNRSRRRRNRLPEDRHQGNHGNSFLASASQLSY